LFKPFHSLQLICWCLLCLVSAVGAEEPATPEDALCPPDYKLVIPKLDQAQINDKSTHVDADSATIDSQSITHFSGDVLVRQSDKQLRADEITYDSKNNLANAQGNIVFTVGEIMIKGDSADLNLQSSQGKIDNTYYQTGTVNGRGTAEVINIKSKQQMSLEQATYTTCPPNKVMWQLNADEINLNNENHQGTAKNMVLDIGNVPVFYLPYIRFPISDDRLSGLMYPAIRVSQNNGTEIAVPYYWNIAPNMDATITPDYMSKRGLMLENEFRYLTSSATGRVELDHMGMDTVYGAERTKFNWSHLGTPEAGWSTKVDYNYVSDDQYLSDFSNSLTTLGSSTTALNRLGSLSYNQSNYIFSANLQDYQNISGAEQYKRLPQLILNTRLPNADNHVNFDVNSEYNNFDINDSSMVVGQRFFVSPYLSYPVVGDAGFIKPKVTLNYLQYDLTQLSSTSLPSDGQSNSPEISVPVFSLDSGIYLDRNTSIGDVKMLQTLEPRVYYLYAPYKDQNNLPVFDTAVATFGQTLLFSENRFSGGDRIGDANQVTLALTSRLYREDNGAELFNATLGQIMYFRDREVVLPGQAVGTSNRSDYIGSATYTPTPKWSLNGDIQYNPDTDAIDIGNVLLQHRPAPGRVINLEYRYTLDQLRTEGASFAWRINPHWQIFGGSQYDLFNDRRVQNFAGFSYDDCCWGVRLTAGEQFDQLVDNTPRYNHAIYLEFILKGLSSLGSGKDVDTLLKNGILGYSK
jgi:LPS-assembly protein